MLYSALSLFALLPLSTAHFVLTWPTNRGFDDDKAGTFPCGGFDDVKTPRTSFPISGGPIQLDMHHTQTKVAVYLSVGNDPGSNYSIQLLPTLSEEGLGNFCLGDISIPSSLNISSGTNATIQVVSNGDPDGGLYQCADVTFTNKTLSSSDFSSHCKNDTKVKVTQQNISGNPNGTTTSPSASASSNAASPAMTGSWALGAFGMAVFAWL